MTMPVTMATTPPPALLAEDVCVSFDGTPILQEVNLTLGRGEWLGVIGPNGAGKSTLLRALVGTVRSRGRIEVDGTALGSLRPKDRARRISMVAQNPVIPDAITVAEYVMLGRTPHLARFALESTRDARIVAEALGALDLGPLAGRFLSTLSGGERQRALLARALVQDAPVLLLDEPTTALDIGHQQEVLDLVDRLRRERGLSVVTTLHDLTLAGRYPDRLLLLVEGRPVAEGSAVHVLTDDHLSRVFGARVRVLEVDGGLVVVPRRGSHVAVAPNSP